MRPVPRRRLDEILPPGVRCVRGRYFWRPTNATERAARGAAGLPVSVPLGADRTEVRRRWAELTGRIQPAPEPRDGTVGALIGRYLADELPRREPDGTSRYAPKTVTEYEHSCRKLRAAFGNRRYARTPNEALSPDVLGTLELQRWIEAQTRPVAANRHLAVLSAIFGCARRWGLTVHNPCIGVERHRERPRRRDVAPWEVEVIRTAAGKHVVGLIVEFADLSGWRQGDILALHRRHLTPEGIVLEQGKTGARQLLAWTPALRAVLDEALARKVRTKRGIRTVRTYVFSRRDGEAYTRDGFASIWQRLVKRAASWAAAAGLPAIANLHFHDLRKKAINDAADGGRDARRFAGHADGRLTQRVYRIRPEKVEPTR